MSKEMNNIDVFMSLFKEGTIIKRPEGEEIIVREIKCEETRSFFKVKKKWNILLELLPEKGKVNE